MRILAAALLLFLSSAPLLRAGSMEAMRSDAYRMGVDARALRPAPAAARDEIKPVPVLFEAIANLIKLIFSPNGDVEIAGPAPEVPQVDGSLTDDQEQEDYSEGTQYATVEPGDYGDAPAQTAPSAQQAVPDGGSRAAGIPDDLRRKALAFFDSNQSAISNRRFIGIVDFAQHSSRQRFWILDVQSGSYRAIRVAHGKGSDPDGDGYATRFSNTAESKASSLGFYVTGALYKGKHGRSMRLNGLSSTNSNALSRAVVVHESDYVREAAVTQGRSFGCLAVAHSEIGNVLASLQGGALIYAGLSNSEF